ncbi:glutamate receptor ionotropic, NMDA 1-like [Daphnia carinata]|uniref:glutamate receptor ionotropic, NMDA 1-like n=1 Tax=Daphnia carinata TaxID=120202 RepID=UPI0028692D26|nr:glutamate receptor ionotropic, NMDA 1-like [Daphnia carinata]
MFFVTGFFFGVLLVVGSLAKQMTGVHLKIAVNHEPPIFSIIRNPTNESSVRYSGFTKDAFQILSSVLGFTFSFVEVTPTMVKNKGSIDAAMVHQLLGKSADIDGRLISPTAERLEYMDFTLAVSVLNFAIIQPMPNINNRFMAPFKPFQSTVWYMIFVAFGATVVFLSMITKCTRSSKPIPRQMQSRVFPGAAWYTFSVLVAQGAYFPSNRVSLRSIAGSWCLVAVVLVYAYNGTLISHVSLPKYEPIVNNWADLAANKNLRVTAQRGSLSANIILSSKTGSLKTLGDSLRRHPEDLLLSLPGELERILHSGCCAYVGVKRLGELIVYGSMIAHGECKLTMGKELDYSQVWTFGVAKNFPYLSSINKGIQSMRQSGLLTRIGKTYLKPIDKCLASSAARPKQSQLTLYDLAGAFTIIFGLGCLFSILVYLLEMVVPYLVSKTRSPDAEITQ